MVNNNYKAALLLEEAGGSRTEILGMLHSACAENSPDAQYALGTLYLHGKYVDKSKQKAIKLLKEAAAQMHPDALFDLGVALEKGEIIEKDTQEAFRCYLHAMIVGDSTSVYEVARCFYYGIGIKKDKILFEMIMDADDYLKK